MKRWTKPSLAALAAATGLIVMTPATAQTPFVGDIITVAFNYCPRDYIEADGSLLAIAQYDVLYTLYGTTYGGDGVNTFGLPDLRGRFSIGQGQGPGLSNYTIGQKSGNEAVTLTSLNLPAHTHISQLVANPAVGTSNSPNNNFPAKAPGTNRAYHTVAPINFANAATVVVSANGGNQPIDIRSPFLTLRHCVSPYGIFPSQN